ncbi:MAG: urate hydroxylase PuuD [Pseudomonadota bacterium]
MLPYLLEWLGLLGRWLHFIVGIAWIGSSFYFVWLDNHLEPPKLKGDDEKGVGGELWSVHGGGFYHAQKYAVAPAQLPETLHWFKWEAYTTWLSGMFLLGLIYWLGADVYLVDASVRELAPGVAVAIGAAFLVGGWLVYDLLCRSPLGRKAGALSALLYVLLGVAAWALCQLFSGRGAYIHFGALIGTIMVANVFFVIIPGQKRMVAATERGEPVNPEDGLRGKQRSVHNTYLTLPVLFVMISNHYAMTFGHAWNWLILMAFVLAGALIRVYFVARHKGNASPVPAVAGVLVLVGVAIAIAPQPRAAAETPVVDTATFEALAPGATARFDDIVRIVTVRCASCHADIPTQPGWVSPPGGVVFNDADDIVRQARDIYEQSVEAQIMPVGNLTHMRDAEREAIGDWFADGAPADWRQ